MNFKPFRSSIIVMVGAAIIIVGISLIKSQPGRGDDVSLELIRSECNRESIIPPQYRSEASRIRNLLKSGSIDRWRDISFRSGKYNEGVYLPHPNHSLNKAGVRINMVELYLRGDKALEMMMPVVQIKAPALSLNLPEYRYYDCLDLFKNDFVDYV